MEDKTAFRTSSLEYSKKKTDQAVIGPLILNLYFSLYSRDKLFLTPQLSVSYSVAHKSNKGM